MIRFVLQRKIVVCLKARAQGFQINATLQIQELVLALCKTVEGINASINLQLAIFKAAGHFHVAEPHFASHLHVLFFERRDL